MHRHTKSSKTLRNRRTNVRNLKNGSYNSSRNLRSKVSTQIEYSSSMQEYDSIVTGNMSDPLFWRNQEMDKAAKTCFNYRRRRENIQKLNNDTWKDKNKLEVLGLDKWKFMQSQSKQRPLRPYSRCFKYIWAINYPKYVTFFPKNSIFNPKQRTLTNSPNHLTLRKTASISNLQLVQASF